MAIWSNELQELNRIKNYLDNQIPRLEKELNQLVKSDDPNVLMLYSRRSLEVIITDLCERELNRPRKTEPLKGIIDKLNREGKVISHIITSMDHVNSLSTYGAHPKDFDPEQVKPVLINLTIVIKWYLNYKGIEIANKVVPSEEKIPYTEQLVEFKKEERRDTEIKSARSVFWKWLPTAAIVIIFAGIFVYPKFFRKDSKTDSEKSIAVMTFKNLTGTDTNDYLAEMQREALYHELGKISQVKQLRIVGPRTTSVFEKNRMNIAEVARDADVEYLVEGSLINTGVVEEILIRLIKIFPEEEIVWDNKYTSDRKNIFRLYNDIAELVIDKIGLNLQPQDKVKLTPPRTVNPLSLEAYARGMAELEKSTAEGIEKGMEYLREAVDIAPEDPFANAGLALGYLTIAHSPLDPGDALEKGEEYAFKALSLDSTIAEVHAALAVAYLYGSWRFTESEKHFKKALELNPNLDMAHYHYSWALNLMGRNDEAIVEHKLAQKYDRYNPLHTAWLGGLYYKVGRYDDAIECALESFEIRPDYPAGYFVLGITYLEKGRNEEALTELKKLAELYPSWLFALGNYYAKTDQREKAEKILQEIESRPVNGWNAWSLTNLNALLGNKDEAFKWLAYEPHHAFAAWAAVDEDLESLHDDPRWEDFLKRLNLPQR